MKNTLYHALSVEPTATQEQIAAGYASRVAMLDAQPYDRNAQIIAKEAFAVLSNPQRRALYDVSLASARSNTVDTSSASNETRKGPGWGMGLAIAVGAGIFSGWWFNRPAPAPVAPAVVPSAIAMVSVPALEPELKQDRKQDGNPLAQTTDELSSEQLFAKLAPSIVRINVSSADGKRRSLGSGVVIAPGTVITNCHVAEGGPMLQVKSGSRSYEARITVADQAHDLCKLDVPSMNAEPITIGQNDELRTGQKVVAIGAPVGLDLTISEGIVSSLRAVDDGTLIQTTAPVSPGSSGGGLFDMRGNLVGIVTFQVTVGQNLNFAAPAEWIGKMKATQGNGIVTKLTGPRTEQRADEPDNELALTAELPGRWACRDTIRDKVFQFDFEPNGQLELRRNNETTHGRWHLVGERIEVRPYSGPMLQVEYLLRDKLILNAGRGFRFVCSRI